MSGMLNSGSGGGDSLAEQRRDRDLEDATPGADTASDLYDPAEPITNSRDYEDDAELFRDMLTTDADSEEADEIRATVERESGTSFRAWASESFGGGNPYVDAARNLGPDWLDEVTAIAIPVVVLAVLAYLLRPFATIFAEVVGDGG